MAFLGTIRILIIDMLRGTNILSELKRISKEQYLTRIELDQISSQKTKQVIAYATSHVPYYKQFKGQYELPVLTKDLIRGHRKEFLSPIYHGKLYPKSTGGSTALPLHYYTTARAQGFMWAGIIHAWKIAGYNLGDKVAFVSGTALVKDNWQHHLFYKLLNIEVLSAYDLSEASIDRYIKILNEKKIKVIYGYPTALNEIALYILKKENCVFNYLKGVVTTSEVLHEKHRLNIEKAFKVVVRNQYGCNEAGISAFECEHGELHLINTASSIEVYNGELYGTNLVNDAFYFIKYHTGDSIDLSASSICFCKRGYPIIENINGRSVDIIVDKNGKKIHASLFSILFRSMPVIEQFQVQFDRTCIDIYLKLNESSLSEVQYNQLLMLVKKQMFFDEYRIYCNSSFLQSANAKHKYVIDNRAKQNVSYENLV
jgi:phenylacetate-CoA ligase